MVKPMKKILLCAATSPEIEPTINYFKAQSYPKPHAFDLNQVSVDIQLTGVGMTATTYALTRYLKDNNPDLILNAGIAGAYNSSAMLGTVYQVVSEEIADQGAIDKNGRFIDLFELRLLAENEKPYQGKKLIPKLPDFTSNIPVKTGHGITLNTVSGETHQIQQLRARVSADLETMEGAAVFYVACMESIPVLALRSISNHVEPRNRANWNIPLAIERLNQTLIACIHQLNDNPTF